MKRFSLEVHKIKARYPDATYVGVAYTAADNWTFLELLTLQLTQVLLLLTIIDGSRYVFSIEDLVIRIPGNIGCFVDRFWILLYSPQS
ncbi:hypothetical protein [Endozoicomonas sp. ALD040]|uniref:hypothetical protein n=1 Tax=unclassified Endozoicomonas TaxID=2644528 RepID=UPI003BB1598F